MQSHKILSIVIPTYNMEELLPRCLDSLTADNSILGDLEVLVVNDGSKDGSLALMQDYQSRFPNTVFAIDKPNGNYGSCVNKGLQLATGKYFRILDADDWFNTEGLVEFIKLLKTIDSDAVLTGYTVEMPQDNKIFEHPVYASPKNTSISVSEFGIIKDMRLWDEDLAMHKITYKTQLLQDINFKHTEGISYTDTEYVFYPLSNIKSIYFTNIYLYKYFVGREGQTVSTASKLKTISHLRKIIDRMLTIDLDNITNSVQKNWCLKYFSFVIASYYHRILVIQKLTKENSKDLKLFDDELKNKNPLLYKELNAVNIKGVKWIKLWRKYNIQIINPKIYELLTGLLKKY